MRPALTRWEKLALAVLAVQLNALTNNARTRLRQVVLVFKPDTLLQWHREFVRCTWTFTARRTNGRPGIAPALEALILRRANENPLGWLLRPSAGY